MQRETPLTTEEALEILDRFPIFLHDEYYLDDDDVEAIVMATNSLRSMYKQEVDHDCNICKYYDVPLFREPCLSCSGSNTYDKWERREEA